MLLHFTVAFLEKKLSCLKYTLQRSRTKQKGKETEQVFKNNVCLN